MQQLLGLGRHRLLGGGDLAVSLSEVRQGEGHDEGARGLRRGLLPRPSHRLGDPGDAVGRHLRGGLRFPAGGLWSAGRLASGGRVLAGRAASGGSLSEGRARHLGGLRGLHCWLAVGGRNE